MEMVFKTNDVKQTEDIGQSLGKLLSEGDFGPYRRFRAGKLLSPGE